MSADESTRRDLGIVELPLHGRVRFNLDWTPSPDGASAADLDLGCLYRTAAGEYGAVQSVGPTEPDSQAPVSAFARAPHRDNTAAPAPIELVELDVDDPDGTRSEGENLTLLHPKHIDLMIVFASIYDGSSDFRNVGARIRVHRGPRLMLEAPLASPAPGLNWCAVLAAGRRGTHLSIAHEERYFPSAYHAARHYGFDIEWKLGIKAR